MTELCDVTGMMVRKGNNPEMAELFMCFFHVSDLLFLVRYIKAPWDIIL